MQIYVDFDGVILDTDTIIDREFDKEKDIKRSDFVQNYDWKKLVNSATIINDSLKFLKKSKHEIFILSKVSSLNEGISKVQYLREHEIFINIHLVPTKISKSDIVNPQGNILIDDKVYNLDEWSSKGGIALFFNKDNLDYDIRGIRNTKYLKINNLEILANSDIKQYYDSLLKQNSSLND